MILTFQVITEEQSTTSYAGHAFGGLAGVLVGTILLENRKVKIFHNSTIQKYFGRKQEMRLSY